MGYPPSLIAGSSPARYCVPLMKCESQLVQLCYAHVLPLHSLFGPAHLPSTTPSLFKLTNNALYRVVSVSMGHPQPPQYHCASVHLCVAPMIKMGKRSLTLPSVESSRVGRASWRAVLCCIVVCQARRRHTIYVQGIHSWLQAGQVDSGREREWRNGNYAHDPDQ